MEVSGDNVAIAYYQTIPHVVSVQGSEYAFAVRANICMAWIPMQHMDAVLNITKQCCGGNRNKVYRLANESDVRRWTNGGGA